MSEILSTEEVAEVQKLSVAAHPPRWGGNPPIVRLCQSVPDLAASHEALRARLAEVEAEHDETRVKLMFAWQDRRAVDRRLAEVEQVVRKVAQHPCYDVREWVGEVVPCGSCPSCITRAVLDKGEQG